MTAARRPGPRSLLRQPAPVVAPLLLGWRLSAHGVTVRLTEVEAYGGQGADPGSHAHNGPTPRSSIMFGPSGRLYVYFTYGMHWCANVVTGPEGEASAVLLRAGEVVDGSVDQGCLCKRRNVGAARPSLEYWPT